MSIYKPFYVKMSESKGQWIVTREWKTTTELIAIFPTQKEAEEHARQLIKDYKKDLFDRE